MIRIDEIYDNTIWPWLVKNKPHTRMFLCEPFGRSDADSIINYGSDFIPEYNYIFFFDQEPIVLARHFNTFQAVKIRNDDLGYDGPVSGHLITSEKNSATVNKICEFYEWKSHYYFFHGWAALDWYRGYDKTFLMQPPGNRKIKKTFISPNRIIAGERQHRLLLLYHIFKNNLTHNWISCPAVCPAENVHILDAVQPLLKIYPDISEVFSQQQFPMDFPGETGSPMHSCWLSLFDESAESLLYLVTETVAAGQRLHLTEKTFKPICLAMPFVIVGTTGSLEYLRSYGFKTFGDFWDESYDTETDDVRRIEKIAELLCDLDSMTMEQKQKLHSDVRETVLYNYHHFYDGAFEEILWNELLDMLNAMQI